MWEVGCGRNPVFDRFNGALSLDVQFQVIRFHLFLPHLMSHIRNP